MQEYGHKLFERLLEDEENQYCFDCGIHFVIKGKKPAHWASINNAVYLCLNCASNHRSFGVNISYIRSITIDSWNENQLRFMAAGGNRRLAELLENFAISRTYAKDILYSSYLLDFHRKWAKVNGEKEPAEPRQADCLKSISNGPNTSDFSYSSNPTNKGDRFASVSSSGNGGNYENHNSSKSSNSWKPDYSRSSSNNSDRFASVGSQYNTDNSSEQPSGYFSTFKYYLGTALVKTIDVAYNIKEKVSEMELGNTLKGAGVKTLEIIKDTSQKVHDSGAMQTVSEKAYKGINYLSNKILGKKIVDDDFSGNNSNSNSSGYTKHRVERDDEYYIKLDEENRKNNYYSSPDYSQRFSSRGPD